MSGDFTIEIAQVVGHRVDVVVTGEVDLLTAPQLGAALDDAASLGERVVVDLRAVEFMDSTGLSALVDAHVTLTAAGKRLRLRDASPAVRRLLQLAGLQQHFAVVDAVGVRTPAVDEDASGRGLDEVLVELGPVLLVEHSLRDDLQRLIRFTCQAMPRCSAASVALLVDGAPTTVAVSGHVALELDLVQYDADEGPCLTALDGRRIRVDVLDTDQRFQHFAIDAAVHQVNSVLSMPITHDTGVVGTLNFYGRDRHAFDDTAESIARLASAQAARAIVRCRAVTASRERRDQLQAQYDQAMLIARARGVLIATQRCSAEQARHLLDNAAANTGDTLVTIARRILATAHEHT